jgi:formamidopyrimidine-DNA glycosylase
MPELPEVETIARQLRPLLVGQRIIAASIYWPRVMDQPGPERAVASLLGRTIAAVSRRAKYLVLSVPPQTLLVHLRMTGQMRYGADPCEPSADRHVQAALRLAQGWLQFRDMRKFGRWYLVDDPAEVLSGLGPEPLGDDFTVDGLRQALQRRRAIKPLLLDQTAVAGLGNIYVDEALWLAGVHPLRAAHTLDRLQVPRLHGAIRQVISQAIANMGTTLRDYRDPRDRPGNNQGALAVYGRQGLPCRRCGAQVTKIVVNNRGTHFCPQCQSPAGDAP